MALKFENYKILFGEEGNEKLETLINVNLHSIIKNNIYGTSTADTIVSFVFQLGSDIDGNNTIINKLNSPVMGFCCKKETSGNTTTYSDPYFCCFTFVDGNKNAIQVKGFKAYKINTGKVNDASFIINSTTESNVNTYKVGVISGDKVLFGLDSHTGSTKVFEFYLPKLSTFLEGPHVDFSDLPAGTYLTKSDQVVLTTDP